MIRKVVFLLLSLVALTAPAQQLAFPGAEGFAAYATGGRGGKVVHVTNLNASGAGSLADAVSQPNRIVVFDVGGVINITNASITISSDITIAGQTAPGEGITIYGGRVIASGNKNIIIRYLRMRGGKSVAEKKCTLTMDDCENVILDHCDVSWGPWDNVHITNAKDITFQSCIISEGIEPQRFGAITDGTRNWTICHCLWINNKSRNPKMKCYLQYYNNVVYNYGMGIIGGHSAADNYQDVMNNYFIAGPDGSQKYFDDWTETDHLYSTGNYFDGNCDGKLNGTLITDYNKATAMSKPYFNATHPMNVMNAADAYQDVAENVGASRVRDIHDRRLIEHLTSLGKKGSFIANEDDLGGIGSVAGGTPPTDTDGDGMPDDWEIANGLNPNVNDATAYTIGGGYANIEHYINSLSQASAIQPSLQCPQNVTVKLTTKTAAKLTWTNVEDADKTIIVEQSEDGKTFVEVKRLAGKTVSTSISGLTAGKIYYFRLKTISEDMESPYSVVVGVNNDFMKGGGGTRANTNPFKPKEGMLYRIINYATVPYNSSTTINGAAKYLLCNADGSLGSTQEFAWDDRNLLWVITAVEGGYQIRNYGTGLYFTPNNVSIGSGDARIGTTKEPSVFTINFTGNLLPSQSGATSSLSMYRINSLTSGNPQIRARNFNNDWIWGSGTLDRSDMIFTFAEFEEARINPDVVGIKGYDSPLLKSGARYTLDGRPITNNKTYKGFYIERQSQADGTILTQKRVAK